MFGYMTVHKDELKVRQFDAYKGCYCGLCHCLHDRYGISGRMTLTYDLTFAAVLLNSLYGGSFEQTRRRCPVHPIKKQTVLQNEWTEYAADMNILLAYYKLLDDVDDDHSKAARLTAVFLHRKAFRAAARHKRQASAIRSNLRKLSEMELRGEESVDEVSGCFGKILGEIFAVKEDRWAPVLRRFGFFLGKFIYMMDAWEDVVQDREKKRYNPFQHMYECMSEQDFDKACLSMMTLTIGAAAMEFEKLPCVRDVDILRNILYDGIWNHYRKQIREKQERQSAKSGDRTV